MFISVLWIRVFSDFWIKHTFIINENIEQNQKESQRLAQLRDTLLPKLMKGEIEV